MLVIQPDDLALLAAIGFGESGRDSSQNPEDNDQEDRRNDSPQEGLAIVDTFVTFLTPVASFAGSTTEFSALAAQPAGIPCHQYDENDKNKEDEENKGPNKTSGTKASLLAATAVAMAYCGNLFTSVDLEVGQGNTLSLGHVADYFYIGSTL
jgi:hypothetical protein